MLFLVGFLDAPLGQSTQPNTNFLVAPPDLYLNMISRKCTIFHPDVQISVHYQYVYIGGHGFWGKTSVHKSNDLLYVVHFIYSPKIIQPRAHLAFSLNFLTSWNSELLTALSNSQKLRNPQYACRNGGIAQHPIYYIE